MTDIRPVWKQLASEKKLTRGDIATLCVFKALKKGVPETAKENLKKSFQPVTNSNKLSNGAYPYFGMYSALRDVDYKYNPSQVFSLLTEEERAQVSTVVAAIKGKGFGEVLI